jgi:hypothetical protein
LRYRNWNLAISSASCATKKPELSFERCHRKRGTASIRLSPALAKAVVRADPALSGASESVHKRIHDELLEVAHPQKLAALRNDLRAHEMGSHVVDRADKALREAAKFAPGEERPFLERVRASAARPKPKAGIDPNDIDALIAERRKRIGLSAPRAL